MNGWLTEDSPVGRYVVETEGATYEIELVEGRLATIREAGSGRIFERVRSLQFKVGRRSGLFVRERTPYGPWDPVDSQLTQTGRVHGIRRE